MAEQSRAQSSERLKASFRDFESFCGLLDIVPKDPRQGKRCKFQLNQIQKLFHAERTGRDIILKPRQVGMTTLELARDVWHFLTHPAANVVVVCQSQDDNQPQKFVSATLRRMFDSLVTAGYVLNFGTDSETRWTLPDRDAALSIIKAGASESSASKRGRGDRVTRLHMTEAAYYDYAEATANALMESIPGRETGSEIVIESTANGASGYFYSQCQSALSKRSAYTLHFFPWHLQSEYNTPLEPGEAVEPESDHEKALMMRGVTPEQLKWYRDKVAEKGQDKMDQEYPSDPETCFLVSGRAFFDQAVTTRLLGLATDPRETKKSNRVRIYEYPIASNDYVFALDCSEGVGGDPSGGVMYHRETGKHVATLDGQFTPYEAALAAVELCKQYNGALLAVERNNHGHAVLQAVKALGYRRVYRHQDDRRGWPTNAVTRPIMLDALEDAHRQGLWKSPDKVLLGQMRKFVINSHGKPEAATGENDDLVIASAIGWAVRSRKSVRGNISGSLAAAL